MARIIIAAVALLAIGSLATVMVLSFNRQSARQMPGPTAPAAFPPAEAEYLDEDVPAEGVMYAVSSLRRKADQDAAAAEIVGKWVRASGWEGEVAGLTTERGGFAVRLFNATGGLAGGFYIVAVVPEEPDDLRKADRATVQGRIDKVEVLPGGVSPIYRIVLNPARIIAHQKFRR